MEGRGIMHFARARTVGCHPAFIAALADASVEVVRGSGWLDAESAG